MNYDLATLLSGLGINPDTVTKDTVRIDFRADYPVLTYTAMLGVPPELLGRALLASLPPEEDTTAEAITGHVTEEN